MILSMTGFGRQQATIGGIDLSVEINSVNRRNLEISVSLPREWQLLEKDIQDRIRNKLSRGKVHVYIQAGPATVESGFHWNDEGLESSFNRLGQVAARLGVAWPPDADALVRLAALNKVDALLPEADTVQSQLLEQVEAALQQMVEMRAAEGTALKDDLAARTASLAGHLGNIQSHSADTLPRHRELLLQRLKQADLGLDLSDERVLKEIAIFADKCDISEEITRLESHLSQLNSCLGEGSPVGRKLEFITQEVNREFNTIGSKANNIEVNRIVIEAKNEIERIREQIQNIE
jgi:uncharacterized protein (TIGR00255 family)